jgi:hypothetical protein
LGYLNQEKKEVIIGLNRLDDEKKLNFVDFTGNHLWISLLQCCTSDVGQTMIPFARPRRISAHMTERLVRVFPVPTSSARIAPVTGIPKELKKNDMI